MLRTSDVIAFVATTDPAKARMFYRDVLGLALKGDEPFALVFDANDTMLRISIVPDFRPAEHTVLGWRVSDIEAAVTYLKKRGVVFEFYPGFKQDPLGIWTTERGDKVAWFKDPDGNALSLTQFHARGNRKQPKTSRRAE